MDVTARIREKANALPKPHPHSMKNLDIWLTLNPIKIIEPEVGQEEPGRDGGNVFLRWTNERGEEFKLTFSRSTQGQDARHQGHRTVYIYHKILRDGKLWERDWFTWLGSIFDVVKRYNYARLMEGK